MSIVDVIVNSIIDDNEWNFNGVTRDNQCGGRFRTIFISQHDGIPDGR